MSPAAQTQTRTGQAAKTKPFSAKVTLIPEYRDGVFTGRPYKAERVYVRNPGGGAREHAWFSPDSRPHNHPWKKIWCKAVLGGYTAIEYVPDGNGGYTERTVTLHAGDPEHCIPHDVFHQVVEVIPGTVTVMTYSELEDDIQNWGNLVKKSNGQFEYEPNTTSGQPGFIDALRHLNPHMRPAEGWVDPFADMPLPSLDEMLEELGL